MMSSPRSTPPRSDALPVGLGDFSLFPPLSHSKTPKIYSLSNSTQSKALPIDSSSTSSSGLKTNSVRVDKSAKSIQAKSIQAGIGSFHQPSSGAKDDSACSDCLKNSSPRVDQSKPTYLNMVDNNLENRFSIDSNHVAGSDTLDIPQEVLDDSVPLWTELIVGRFLDTPPHIGVIQVIVNKIWNVGAKKGKIIATELEDRMVQFKVSDQKKRDKILERGMWNIARVPMIVSAWFPDIEELEPAITTLPLWITIKNIPKCLFSRVGISYLASAAGTPKKLHQDTEMCKKFDEAKVFMNLNLTKELPKELFVKEKDSGVIIKLTFHYPWLPPRCSGCGKWGHLQAKCKAPKKLEDISVRENLQVIPKGTNVERFEVVHSPREKITEASGSSNEAVADIGYVYKELVSYSNSLKKGPKGMEQGSGSDVQMENGPGEIITNEKINSQEEQVKQVEDLEKTEQTKENLNMVDIQVGSDSMKGKSVGSVQGMESDTCSANETEQTKDISEGNSGKEDGETDHSEWITPSRPIKNPKLPSKNQKIVLETRFEALVLEDDTALETDSTIGDDLQKDTEWLSPSHSMKSPKQISKKNKPIILDTPVEEITGFDSDSDYKPKRKIYGQRHSLVSFDLG